jgi:acyl-CoA reductase-like NAD-dependent aldehyde dehydrogenase
VASPDGDRHPSLVPPGRRRARPGRPRRDDDRARAGDGPSARRGPALRAVAAASAARRGRRETPAGERADALLALAERVREHAGELAALESRNVGKPLAAAREEVDFCADNLRFFAGAGRALPGLPAAGESGGRRPPTASR